MFTQVSSNVSHSPTFGNLSIDSCIEIENDDLVTDSYICRGKILSKYFCFYSEKKLEVYSKFDGSLVSLYSPNFSDTIRNVVEYSLCSHPSFSEKHLFIISTSRSTLGPHFILLFNPEVSRVVKAIQIAFSPECICPLIENGKKRAKSNPECNREWPLMEVSRGLIAVGGGNGTVVLMDLRLDDEEEVFGENTPSEATTYFSHMITDMATLLQIREECISDQSHPSYILPGIRIPSEKNFNFRTPGQEHIVYPSQDVWITFLVHISTINGLVVGYNLGVIQLFDIINLDLLFSSEIDNFPSPVLNIIYQEPEDDPRDFIYLWTVRGSFYSSKSSHAIISLYQLFFNSSQVYTIEKDDLNLREKEFSHFLNGDLKFRHFLSPSPYLKQIALSKDTRIISSGIIHQYKSNQEQAWSPNLENTDSDYFPNSYYTHDLTLSYFLYSTTKCAHRPGLHLALFDLNLWYCSQMRSALSPDCNFYHVYDLENFFHHFQSRSQSKIPFPHQILDLKLNSLERFNLAPPIPEVFLLPTSISISMNYLLPSVSLSCYLQGEQERALNQVAYTLSSGYIDNIDLVTLSLIHSGLTSTQISSIDDIQGTPSWEDKVLIMLNASLEFCRIEPIYACIRNAQNQCGDIPLCLVSNWTLFKFDELRNRLIDQSNELVSTFPACNSTIIASIRSLLYRFHHLSLILSRIPTTQFSLNYQSQSTLLTPSDYKKSIDIITFYNENLIWMLAQPTSIHSSYRHKTLKTHYQKLRKFHNSDLIIDQIIAQLNSNVFDNWVTHSCEKDRMENETADLYPPHSPLDIFESVLDFSHVEFGHIIILYFLVDLGMQLEDLTTESLTNSYMRQFPQIPNRLPSLAYSFWLIDNAHYQNGINELLSIPSSIVHMFYFVIPKVLEYLLKSDLSNFVHLLISVHRPLLDTINLFHLYLRTLMECGNIFDAIRELYNFFPIGSTHGSLDELLDAGDLPALKRLVHMPLDSIVLSQVIDFLHNRDSFLHYEILIILLLEQNKIVDGIQTFIRIKSTMNSLAQTEEEKARLCLLDQLIQAFSKVSACDLALVSRLSKEHRTLKREISLPTPLSSKVRKQQMACTNSKNELLESINDKVTELKHAKYNFEEIKFSSPCQMESKYTGSHRYKRLSELTYPCPTVPPLESLQPHTFSPCNVTPLKFALDKYMNKSSPKELTFGLPPSCLIRPVLFPSSHSPLNAQLSFKPTTPSSILKPITPKGMSDSSPPSLNFNSSETELINHNFGIKKTRFILPSSLNEMEDEENDVTYQSPLSSPVVTQPYYSPPQEPEQTIDSEFFDTSNRESPIKSLTSVLDIRLATDFTTYPQSDETSPAISTLQTIPDIPQVNLHIISTGRVTDNLGDHNVDTTLSNQLNSDHEQFNVLESEALISEKKLPGENLEQIFDFHSQVRSLNSVKPEDSQHSLDIPELSRFIPEIERLEKSSRLDQGKRFSPISEPYPLSKYAPFSVVDEKNKIFASLQLGECPFIISTSSLPSHKENVLPLKSVETTTASYITQDTIFSQSSPPSTRSSRTKSSESKRSEKEARTPNKTPQHHYYTRAKAPSTPKLQTHLSSINFLPTVPVDKQTKPPKVTLFNKIGTLRRSQRLKERESTSD